MLKHSKKKLLSMTALSLLDSIEVPLCRRVGMDASQFSIVFIAFQNSFWDELPNFLKNLVLLSQMRATTVYFLLLYTFGKP